MSHRRDSPEAGASLLSRLTYHWFTPFVYEAYRKPLELQTSTTHQLIFVLNTWENCSTPDG